MVNGKYSLASDKNMATVSGAVFYITPKLMT